MNEKILKLFIIYVSLCFAFISINVSGTTIIKTVGTFDGRITINPAEPNGNFCWYITPVYVTFHAEDDIQLAYIYYKVKTEGQADPNQTQVDIRNEHTAKYNLTIAINKDGVHTASFYAVDHVGNIGPVHSSDEIKIDMTSPEVSLNKEKISFHEIKFTADATDITSGIQTVIFYVDDNTEPAHEDTTFPYEFIWSGIGNHTITAKARDVAGNEAFTEMSTSKSSDFIFKAISKTIESDWVTLTVTIPKVTNVESVPSGFIFVFGGSVDIKIVHLEPGNNYIDLEVLNKPLYIWENEIITINSGAFVRLNEAKGLFLPSFPLCIGICNDYGIIG